jgi:ammonium transporter, Amt family
MNADDGLDAFGLHGIGGYVGSILTGLFAADYVAALDGVTVIPGGWINGHWVQLGYQLAGSTAYNLITDHLTVGSLGIHLWSLISFFLLWRRFHF